MMDVSSSVEEFAVQAANEHNDSVRSNGDTNDDNWQRLHPESLDTCSSGSRQTAWNSNNDSSSENDLPSIIPLNVGGVYFITRRSTLTKFPDSMLAVMFSGRHKVERDKSGHFFLDTNGVYFGYILDYLRHESIPPREVTLKVYQEAGYFGLTNLQQALMTTPEVGRMIVCDQHRRQFPSYFAFRQQVIQLGMKNAVNTKIGAVIVFAHRGECKHIHNNCVTETAHLKVGPWEASVDEETFVRTLHSDLIELGFNLTPFTKKRCKWYVQGQTCPRGVYTLTFTFT